MKNLIVFVLFFINSFVFAQTEIQNKAINYIIQKVGKSFYNKHISLNEKYSNKNMIVFNFSIQQSPSIIKLLVININEKNEIDINNSLIDNEQLKKCIKKPFKCNLPMNEDAAIEIAKKEGFIQDIKQVRIGFGHYGINKNTFIWSFKKISENPNPSDTEILLINPVTGEVEHIIQHIEE